ncbi:DUF2461 domain-containing protein [Flavobacterium sp.]|uniref:DUF2461 domain-containing protein n=1 Tax=Flavobacterium sp. TaxID=239 RepID=UPI002FD8DC37
MLTIESLQFLEDLKQNNNTEWFHAQKKRYENYKTDYKNLIASLLEKMKMMDPALTPLEVKNCTFRINRDIRFSKDKSPYKTNLGIWMPIQTFTKNAPGYYIHYEKGNSFIAGGLYCPEPEELKKIRTEVAYFYEDLKEIISDKSFQNSYGDLDRNESNSLKKAPKDFDPNHEAIAYLKLKSFTASCKIEDTAFLQPDFCELATKKLLPLKPLNAYLQRALAPLD